jgi:CRP/FNR family transcriptional regulator
MVTSTAILSRYSFYRHAAASLQQEIRMVSERVHVPKGQVLFDAGQECHQVVLVGKGCIRVCSKSSDGREVTLYQVNPGETCPTNLMCVLLGKLAPATAVVAAPLEAIVLPALQFQNWVDAEPEIRLFAIESIGDRLVDIIVLFEDMVFNHIDIRLAEFLHSHFSGTRENKPVITLSGKEIALQLGSTPHVISRLLEDFAAHGAISLDHGGIFLEDNKLLSQISGIHH